MTSHLADDEEATPVGYDPDTTDRFFLSESRGLVIVESDDTVWECEIGAFQLFELPADAVELKLVTPPSCGLCTSAGEFIRINDKCAEHGDKALEDR